MKIKWTEIQEAFLASGFTDSDYGHIYKDSTLNDSIGIEEYACGNSVCDALQRLGIEVEIDIKNNKYE